MRAHPLRPRTRQNRHIPIVPQSLSPRPYVTPVCVVLFCSRSVVLVKQTLRESLVSPCERLSATSISQNRLAQVSRGAARSLFRGAAPRRAVRTDWTDIGGLCYTGPLTTPGERPMKKPRTPFQIARAEALAAYPPIRSKDRPSHHRGPQASRARRLRERIAEARDRLSAAVAAVEAAVKAGANGLVLVPLREAIVDAKLDLRRAREDSARVHADTQLLWESELQARSDARFKAEVARIRAGGFTPGTKERLIEKARKREDAHLFTARMNKERAAAKKAGLME